MTATATLPEPSKTGFPDFAVHLLLARLLVVGKSTPVPSKIREQVGKYFPEALSSERFQDLAAHLRASGLLEPKGYRLTSKGRERALGWLGLKELPPQWKWQTLQSRYLVPRALGLNPESADDFKKIADKEKLAALLLKRRYNLPVGTGNTVAGVLEALACRELGHPEQTKLAGLKSLVLNRMLGSDQRLPPKKLKSQAPRVLLGTTRPGKEGLAEVVLKEWAAGQGKSGDASITQGKTETKPRQDEPFDLEAFAQTVQKVARTCPTGRFGDNKVFISHVWRRLAEEPSFAGMDLDTFKRRLVEANTARLLTLSRADLVSVMDPADVSASETHDLNAVFHFILIEREQP